MIKIIKNKTRSGFSLVDVMISIVVLAVAVIGTTNYRYFASTEAKKGWMHITAARTALMLCENWRGVQGDETFDPITSLGSEIAITASNGPEKEADFILLQTFRVEINDTYYYCTMSYKDVQAGLRALNVIMAWSPRDQKASNDETEKTFSLTVYALTG
jgi:hypothetical protein